MSYTFTDSSPTISTTEFSLPNASTTLTPQTTKGLYQLFVDSVANMIAGDVFRIRIYERMNGGTQQKLYEATLGGAQSQAFVAPALLLGDGWDMTMIRLAGADRVFPVSIRKVA